MTNTENNQHEEEFRTNPLYVKQLIINRPLHMRCGDVIGLNTKPRSRRHVGGILNVNEV